MSCPIRILHVLHALNCGGAENMIMNLYRNIDRDKIQFDFLVHTNEKCFFDDEIEKLGGKIYRVPYYNMLNYSSYKKALNDFFKSHPEIAIVHGHLGSCAYIYLKVAKKYGCRTIAHSHNSKPDKINAKNTLYKLFSIKTRSVADYFIGCSIKAGQYRYGKKIVNSDRFTVLKNAIDTPKFAYDEKTRSEVRNEFNLTDNYIIGHIGRFNTVKNHTFLIDILAELVKKDNRVVAMLVGGGDLQPQIEEKVKKLNLRDNVIFTGVRSDANRLLQAMDCFVFPSLYEGLPVTLIEAQAAGLPCIVSDVITKEVQITEQVKYLPLDDPKKWCDAIAKEKANIIRLNSTEIISESGYDIHDTAEWLTDFYRSSNLCNI